MNKCPITGEVCNKHRSFKVTEVKDGKATKDFQLCENCLASYATGSEVKEVPIKAQIDPSKTIEVVSDLLGFLTKGAHEIQKVALKGGPGPCPKCGGTFEDMIKSEKVGCASCYDHFGDALQMVIKKTQGTLKHVGKVPKNWKKPEKEPKKKIKVKVKTKDKDVDEFIAQQNVKMLKVIEKENYEKAALIRDKLTAIVDLREKLRDAISDEDFEEATLIRDTIQNFIFEATS